MERLLGCRFYKLYVREYILDREKQISVRQSIIRHAISEFEGERVIREARALNPRMDL